MGRGFTAGRAKVEEVKTAGKNYRNDISERFDSRNYVNFREYVFATVLWAARREILWRVDDNLRQVSQPTNWQMSAR
jgi:hypothetical protein